MSLYFQLPLTIPVELLTTSRGFAPRVLFLGVLALAYGGFSDIVEIVKLFIGEMAQQ